MSIRVTILVFTALFFIMLTAGTQSSRAPVAAVVDAIVQDPARGQIQPAEKTDTAPGTNEYRPGAGGLVRI